ncbi:hypothetical protein [Leifsonia aquatica]|uniref:hypothetical protein n=1 Tax=Leifsonia aquatica TaxID=144185 RepID=UPI00382B6390
MNLYGKRARDRWGQLAPTALAQMDRPEAFFEELGETIATRVDQLTPELAGTDNPSESALEKTGRLNAARLQAEEIVFSELVSPEPEISNEDAFQEWRATNGLSLDWLADWAETSQRPDSAAMPIEDLATHHGLPEEFLRELQRQENPYRFLLQNEQLLESRLRARFVTLPIQD